MADTSGVLQASSDVGPGFDAEEEEKDKEKRLTALMESLKMRAGQLRSSVDAAKLPQIDITHKHDEKSLLHQHLERLQKAFKGHMSLMVDRLELCAKEVGLKFTAGHPDGNIFIGSDMFYVEVRLEASSGKVKDVMITQGADTVPSPEITRSLRDGNTDLFVEHLKGLSAVYNINGDEQLRSKCFLAMQSLETDLGLLARLQSSISSVSSYIHKTPLGIVEPRVAGLPMEITYFVGPYDLLDTQTRTSVPMTVESIRERKLGHSVTVGIESSTLHTLPTMPLMTISKTADGKSLPSFAAFNNLNSSSLPAVFVLRLQRPLPMALSIIKKIQATTGIDFLKLDTVQPLLSLLVQATSRKGTGNRSDCDTSHGLSVSLPDQHHKYYFSTVNGSADLRGSMVSSIPFVHPTRVPHIIMLLRQQVLFNTMISSCIRSVVTRPDVANHDEGSVMTFEVCPVSLQHITVLFEHPLKDTMTTGEFDLCDVTAVKCKICTAGNEEAICNDEYTTQVLQRCLSLPVTLRAVMQKARARLATKIAPPSPEPYLVAMAPPLPPASMPPSAQSVASLMLSKVGQERRQAFVSTHMYHDRVGSLHRELMSGGTVQQNVQHMQQNAQHMQGAAVAEPIGITNNGAFEANYIDPTMVSNDLIEAMKAEKISRNPMLARLLDQDELPSSKPVAAGLNHSMLSALLDDDSSGALTPVRHRKSRKRKSLAESRSPVGSSPTKHYRSGDEDGASGSGSCQSQDVGCCINSTSPLAGLLASTSPSGCGENYTHESHVLKLASTLDNIIKHESRHLSKCQHSELASILNEPDNHKKPSPRPQSLSNDLDRGGGHCGGGDCHKDSSGSVDSPLSAFQRTNSNEHIKINSTPWPSSPDVDGRGTRVGRNSSFDRQLKGGETKDGDGRIKGGGELTCDSKSNSNSGVDFARKTTRLIRGSVESGQNSVESDVCAKEQTVTPTDFIADPKLASTPKSGRSHSGESDPFDFTASLLGADSNLVGAESDSTEMDLDACDRQAFGCATAVAPTKVTRGATKTKNISTDAAPDAKERKKERRNHKEALSTWSNSAKSKPYITVKVNTKALTTEMIVKESPRHCTPSPDLSDEPKAQKSKDSKKAVSAEKPSDDLTNNSDAPQPPSSGSNSAGSGHRMSNGSKQLEPGAAVKPSKGKTRKQRVSKHGDGEKKRRRAEESKKDHLSKKQKIYDFDAEVNDTDSYQVPHVVLKPTKIKITTAGGRMQVQPSVAVTPPAVSSKTPPLTSTKYNTASSTSTAKSAKPTHGVVDRVSPKLGHSGTAGSRPNSRLKSDGGGAGRERVDSKLQRTPTIKLKPIAMPHNTATGATASTKSSHSPATPAAGSGKSSTTPIVITNTPSSSSAGHAKNKAALKTRKNSLSAVIDKLTMQHSGGSGGALGICSEKDMERATKETADAIRLKILSEGNKPSTPPKESFRSSQSGVKGSRLTFESKLNLKSLEHRRTSQPQSSSGSTAHHQVKPTVTKQAGGAVATPGSHKGVVVSGDVVASSRTESAKSTTVVNNLSTVSRGVSLPKSAVSVTSSGQRPPTPASTGLKTSTPPLVSRTASVPTPTGQRTSVQGQKPSTAQSGVRTSTSVSSKQSSANPAVNTPKTTSALAAGCTKAAVATTATSKYSTQLSIPKPVSSCTAAAIKSTAPSGSKTPSSVQSAPKLVQRSPTPDISKARSASPNLNGASATSNTKNVAPNKASVETAASRQSVSHDTDRQRKSKADVTSTAIGVEPSAKRHFLDVVLKISSSPGNSEPDSRVPSSDTAANGGGSSNQSSVVSSSTVHAKPTPAHVHARSHSIHCTDTARSNKSFRTTEGSSIAATGGRITPTARGVSVNNVPDDDGGVLDLSAVGQSSGVQTATEPKPSSDAPSGKNCDSPATSLRDTCVTPTVDNSQSENKENTKFDDVFKAPTPKSAKNESSRDTAAPRSRPVASPRSDASSPEDGLVIDCPGYSARSPSTKLTAAKSPASPSVCPPRSPAVDAVKSAASPSARKPARISPVKSPMSQRNLVGSPATNSPCEIDDDLMDAALML